MNRIPDAAEIQAAAQRLTAEGVPDLLDGNGIVRPDKRAQVAKVVQRAATETRQAELVATNATTFAARIREIEKELDAAGVRYETTARVVGAIAAPLWRELKENTAHAKPAR
jgi:hypothetical protein